MGLWEIFVLAIVQGLTEFLPISSSGHLVIAGAMFPDNVALDARDVIEVNIVLHVGTLLSILAFFGKRIVRLLGQDRRTLGLLLVGSVPAALVGVPLETFGVTALGSPLLAGCMLPITGLMLLTIPRLARGDTPYQRLSYRGAWWIGVVQAVALLPGISRSGSTITVGLANRLSRESAATFSFLLAVPAIAGGALFGAKDLLTGQGGATPAAYLAVGVIVSFATGMAALWWVVRWLENGQLHYFAWWCIPVGIAVVIWQLSTMGDSQQRESPPSPSFAPLVRGDIIGQTGRIERVRPLASQKSCSAAVPDERLTPRGTVVEAKRGRNGFDRVVEVKVACRGWSVGHDKS